MGPDVAIGGCSWAFQRAYPTTSAEPPKKINWPSRIHRQLHTHMQWAHPAASAALPNKIMGPDVAISSRSWAFQWAYPIASAELPKKLITVFTIASLNIFDY